MADRVGTVKPMLRLLESVAATVATRTKHVVVADSPGLVSGKTTEWYDRLGLPQMAARVGFSLLCLECADLHPLFVSSRLHLAPIPALQSDFVVSLTHVSPESEPSFRGPLLAASGLIPGLQRRFVKVSSAPSKAFATAAVDAVSLINPALNIALVEGERSRSGLLALSHDAVALEACLLNLLGRGRSLELKMASDAGLGIGWADCVNWIGDLGRRCTVSVAPGSLSATGRMSARRAVSALRRCFLEEGKSFDPSTCSRCQKCRVGCPVHAISLDRHGKIEIDEDRCCHCFRCNELCPEGAMRYTIPH